MKPNSTEFYPHEIVLIVFMSLYCGALVVGALYFQRLYLPGILDGQKPSELVLLDLVLAAGVIGSGLREVAELFVDVGKRRYNASWNLSYLMRPLEGIGMAFVTYAALRGGVGFLNTEQTSPNALGYVAIGVLSGMFSHQTARILWERLKKMLGGE